MKTSFSSWLTAVLVAMGGLSCAAQEVLTPQIYFPTDYGGGSAITLGVTTNGVPAVIADDANGYLVYVDKGNLTNTLGYKFTSDGITDFGGQVGNDRVIVARDGYLFEIKQASDYSGSYGSVAFGGGLGAASVTRGFTNELGQLEAYTIANAGGGRQFHKMNFTIQATTALPSYGTFDVNLVIQSLDAYKVGQTSNTLRFLYTTTENNRLLLYDRGHPGADTYGYEIGLPAGSTVTDLAYDQPAQLLYLCGLYRTNSSDIGFIGTVPFVSKAQTIPVISSIQKTNDAVTVTTTNGIGGSVAVLYGSTQLGPGANWVPLATNNFVGLVASKTAIFTNVTAGGSAQFFRVSNY